MFTFVSGANFFGEIAEWSGFALACWSLPSLSFALFTALNIGPRAIQHHKYVKKNLNIFMFHFFLGLRMTYIGEIFCILISFCQLAGMSRGI